MGVAARVWGDIRVNKLDIPKQKELIAHWRAESIADATIDRNLRALWPAFDRAARDKLMLATEIPLRITAEDWNPIIQTTGNDRALSVAEIAALFNTWESEPVAAVGESNARARLTAEQVAAIKLDTRPTRIVAAEYETDKRASRTVRPRPYGTRCVPGLLSTMSTTSGVIYSWATQSRKALGVAPAPSTYTLSRRTWPMCARQLMTCSSTCNPSSRGAGWADIEG